MSKFHRLPIASVERETRDAVAITFAVPETLREQFRYAQGQHLTLRADIGGEDVRRSYSICSAVQDGALRIAVKKSPGGVFSTWANDALKAGDTIDVMPPLGHFNVPLDASATAALFGLRGRQRHHAAPVDREDHAGRGTGEPLHAGLRQPRFQNRDVQGRAGGAQGHATSAVSTSFTCCRARRRTSS